MVPLSGPHAALLIPLGLLCLLILESTYCLASGGEQSPSEQDGTDVGLDFTVAAQDAE